MAGRLMLCALCTVTLYKIDDGFHVWAWNAEKQERERQIKDVIDAISLAELGTTFLSPENRVFRPLAVTQVRGTLLCGHCAGTALEEMGFSW